MAVPFRIGVMQLTMEPLDEMLASARAMDAAGMDTIWLAEAYPVVAQARDGGALVDRRLGADGARDRAPDDRLGHHLAVHAAPGAGRDGRARRAGGSRAGPLHPRLRDLEDLPEQRRRCRRRRRSARCATRSRSCAACSAARRSSTPARPGTPTFPRCRRRRTRRAACRRSTSPRPRRRCRRSPARSATAA